MSALVKPQQGVGVGLAGGCEGGGELFQAATMLPQQLQGGDTLWICIIRSVGLQQKDLGWGVCARKLGAAGLGTSDLLLCQARTVLY